LGIGRLHALWHYQRSVTLTIPGDKNITLLLMLSHLPFGFMAGGPAAEH
jgi:hypothetical protein